MGSRWPSIPLADVVRLKRGYDLPAPDRTHGDVPILGSFGVTGWHNVAKVVGPGVTIGRSGASIGVATFTTNDYWPLNTALYVYDFMGNDPRWVYWMLRAVDFTAYNSGSAQPSLNRNYLSNIPVLVPPIGEQRRIAGVLGALDDLMDVNRTLIRDQEKLAGCVASQMRDGNEVLIGDVCDVYGGGTPSTKVPAFWDGDIPWATPSDVTALPSPYISSTARQLTREGLAACSSKLLPKGTILMTSRATIGAFAVTEEAMAVNQGFIAVVPRGDHDRWFLFHHFLQRVPEFQQRANGSTFPELSRGAFKNLTIPWPDESARRRLSGQLEPLHRSSAALEQEIRDLASARDELLPLLISGRVRVGDVA